MHSEFNEAKLRLRLWCIADDWGSGLAKLQIDFNLTENGELDGLAEMNQRSLEWAFRFSCCGYDLAEFRKQVLALHAGHQAVAELTNMESFFSLTLETIPSPERTLLISGRVECISPDYNWKIPFGGFRGDASYLPRVASNIADFLTVTNVPVAHPMVQTH